MPRPKQVRRPSPNELILKNELILLILKKFSFGEIMRLRQRQNHPAVLRVERGSSDVRREAVANEPRLFHRRRVALDLCESVALGADVDPFADEVRRERVCEYR